MMSVSLAELAPAVAVFLFRTAIVTTMILLAALCSAALFRRKSAAIRHGVWFAGIAGCWIGPVLVACLPAYSLWIPAPLESESPRADVERPMTQQSVNSIPRTVIDEDWTPSDVDSTIEKLTGSQRSDDETSSGRTMASMQPSDEESKPSQHSMSLSSFRPSWFIDWFVVRSDLLAGWLVALWFAVAAGLTWSLGLALLKTNRLCGASAALDADVPQQMLSALRTELHVRPFVEVRLSRQVTVPMTAGMVRPCLLMPMEARQWPPERWQAVLRHELGHVQRRDLLTQFLAELAAAVWWFQPLLWHAARRLRVEREFACDDLVLRSGIACCDYADQLLHVASQALGRPLVSPALVSMASPTNLRRRVDAILNAAQDRASWSRHGLAMVVTTFVLFAGIIVPLTPTISESKPPRAASPGAATALQETQEKNPPEKTAAQTDSETTTSVVVLDASGQPIPAGELAVSGETHRGEYFSSKSPIQDGKAAIAWKSRQLATATLQVKAPGYIAHFKKYARPKDEASFAPEPRYEFRLNPGIVIGGKVVDQNGKPVANAKVYAYCPADKPIESGIDVFEQTVATNANGEWQMSGAPPDLPQLSFRFREPARAELGDARVVVPSEHAGLMNQTDVRTLQLPDMAQGTVVDPEGRPIEGAFALFAGRNFYKDYSANLVPRTDAAGTFPIANLAQGSQIVTIFSPEWALQTVRVEFPLQEPLKITLHKGKRVEFRAVDEQGTPVAGIGFYPEAPRDGPFTGDAQVNYLYVLDFLTHRDLLKNKTNERGEFLWENAPDESLGYQIISSKMLSQPGGDYGPDGSPHRLVFRPIIPLNISIVDDATGQPIPEYRTYQGTHFKANSAGSWSWSLERPSKEAKPGLLATHLHALDRLIQYRIQADGYRPAMTAVFDAANLPNDPISVELRLKKDAGFDGSVQTAASAAAAGAKIYTKVARREEYDGLKVIDGKVDESSATSVVAADAEGRFHLPPRNEPFVCFIWHEAGCAELMNVELYQQPKIVLQPWASIQGELRKRGTPAEDLKVMLGRNEGRSPDSDAPIVEYQHAQTTGKDGRYRFDRVVTGNWMQTIVWDDTRINFNQAYLQYSTFSVKPGQALIQGDPAQAVTVRGQVSLPEGAGIDWDRSYASLIGWQPADSTDDAARRRYNRRRIQLTRHGLRLSQGKTFEFFGVEPREYELVVSISQPGDSLQFPKGQYKMTITPEMFQKKTHDAVVDLGDISVLQDAK